MTDNLSDGCPVCGWSGEVARTCDYSHNYYTHIIVQDGEMFWGKTCSMRTRPERPSLLSRLLGAVRSIVGLSAQSGDGE